MKRLLSFLIGAVLGAVIVYAIRRFMLNQSGTTVLAPDVSTGPEIEPPAPPVEKPTAQFTVRRTGSQSHGDGTEEIVSQPSANGHTSFSEDVMEVKQDLEPTVPPSKVEEVSAEKEQPSEEEPADFTIIEDIGPIFNRKLHEAGITSFNTLAALSPEEVANIVGTNVTRVERNQWREQAQKFAEGGQEQQEQKPKPAKKSKEQGK